MNHKSSTSSSSVTPSQFPVRSVSSSSNAHSTPTPRTPAVIPLDYDYQTMSPSSLSLLHTHPKSIAASTPHTYRTHTHTRIGSASSRVQVRSSTSPEVDVELDNPYSSLFGDPVPPPPPPDFLSTQLEAAHLFRPAALDISSGEDEPFGRTVTLDSGHTAHARLFSNVPFNSTFTSRRLSDGSTLRNFDVLSTPVSSLRPPDIQILPNSSGGSSSEPQDSPNYALLTPDNILRRPTIYDISDEPADVTELLETMTISDATGRREYSEATRRVSSFSEDFKSNVGSLSNTQPVDTPTPLETSTYARQFSNESYSSSEWFRPATHDYPEFSKIPRLRPSSKNVMSIKRDEMPMNHSPVAAMINDSNGSSSGEERQLNTTQVLEHPTVSLDALTPPARPPDPSPSRLREIEKDLLFSPPPAQYPQQRRNSSIDSLGPTFPTPPPPAAPPPELPTPIQEETEASEETNSIKREMSPVIIRASVATGSDYRVEQPRLHKKTAFSIITDKSPQSSRAQSPSSYAAQQRSPSKASLLSDGSTKPIAKPRYNLKHKSLSSIQLRLPQLPQLHQMPSDDSPRPSVQFNMSGRYSPGKMPHRGILHHRESLTSSQDTPLPSTTPTPTPTSMRRHSTLPPSADLVDGNKMRSCEMLPLITDPYRTAIPRLHRSTLDLHRESAVIPPGALPRPLKPNPNPTRKQKGLLRVVNGTEMSHIPLRSNWTSMDDLALENRRKPFLASTYSALQKRRRSSSTSPERRSSTVTASDRRSSNLSTVTTSDFSFRRPSVTPPAQRRKSILPALTPTAKRRQSLSAPHNFPLASGRTSRTKIAKPTTLSPIIGTPNKDSSAPSSPIREAVASLAASETPSDGTSRRDSLSKIPVRSSSHGNSRSNSRMSSHPGSRSNSPLKDFTAQLPLSGLTSRATSSRTPSRATVRSESQPASDANSRAASRSTSRASTRPISRAASRTSSRPNSRMEQAKELANSRSNSRMSTHSVAATPRAGSVSPRAGHRTGASPSARRRKSISLSPQPNRRPLARRQSLSPPGKGRLPSRGRRKAQREQSGSRHSSNSRIPLRATGSSSRTVRSPAGKNVTAATRSPVKAKAPVKMRKPSPMGRSASQRKKATSAKKAPTSVHKPESSVKRTPSSVGKQAAAVKKQPSNLQKTGGSNLRREASNVQKNAAGMGAAKAVKREASSISVKKPGTSGSMAAAGDNKRQMAAKGTAAKAAEAKTTVKATESGVAAKKNGVAAISAAGVIDTAKAAAATAAVATAVAAGSGPGSSGSSVSGVRRQPSNVSLVRMASRMSLMSLKRSDSNLSKKTLVPALAEETLPVAESNGQPAPLRKTNSRGQLMTPEEVAALPATILEKSQKTLENIQKTVTEATDEIHKTIHENLSDLKNLESDMGRMSDSAGSPTSSVATVVENRGGKGVNGESVTRAGTAEGAVATKSQAAAGAALKSPLPPTLPIEADVSVLNAASQAQHAGTGSGVTAAGRADAAAAAERNYEYDIAGKAADGALNAAVGGETPQDALAMHGGGRTNGADDEIKRRSPDGQGGSAEGSGNGSREFLREQDEDTAPPSGCCRCCTRFCMPCRRSRCSRCCRRKQSRAGGDEAEEPVLSATSSATTTHLAVIDETARRDGKPTKTSCWQKLNCCKRCRKKPTASAGGVSGAAMTAQQQATTAAAAPAPATRGPTPPKQGKCGRCWSRVFCCRSVNKVDPTTGDETQVKKCCFCIPCRRKRDVGRGSAVGSVASAAGSAAWQDPERGITATDASVLEGAADVLPKQGCCKRFWTKMLCCRKKQLPKASDSRRASMKAPPPPAEDTRRKLHVDLVEYNSKMKGAIPVLPLYLAWFCAICNTVLPGLGTLLSGFFCICVGIPRFSQYDSAKARLGALIINTIVAVAQLFCVLFCFVGWGWSIWWGTIMLKCARKLSKIKKVERLEMEEEKRQAEATAAAANAARMVAVTNTETETAKT